MAKLTHMLSQLQAAAEASAKNLVRVQEESATAVSRLNTKVWSRPGFVSVSITQSSLLFRRNLGIEIQQLT